MSILETDKIDMIATRPDSNVVKLVVSDHLDWDDVDGHSSMLQAKINTYISFVETGQLLLIKEPPIPENPDVMISLAVPDPLGRAALDYLSRVRESLADIDIGFAVEIHDS